MHFSANEKGDSFFEDFYKSRANSSKSMDLTRIIHKYAFQD